MDESPSRAQRTESFMRYAMDAHGGAVYVAALSHTQSHADAQDVAQDVFVSLYTSNVAFKDDEHLRAWLLRATINRCRDLHRSAWRRRVEPIDPVADIAGSASMDPATAAIANLEASPVWQALQALAPKLREAALLFYVEQYPTDKIAQIVGCTPGAVRTRLNRARAQMRKTLAQTLAHEGGI